MNGWESGDMIWNEYAAFAEDTYQASEKLTILGGLRLDGVKYQDSIGAALSNGVGYVITVPQPNQSHTAPRLAFSYLLNDKEVIKASYQQGFLCRTRLRFAA